MIFISQNNKSLFCYLLFILSKIFSTLYSFIYLSSYNIFFDKSPFNYILYLYFIIHLQGIQVYEITFEMKMIYISQEEIYS